MASCFYCLGRCGMPERSRIRRLGRAARYILASVWLLLGTQWLLALLLTTGALISSAEAVRKFWILPFSVTPVLPLMFSVATVLPHSRSFRLL